MVVAAPRSLPSPIEGFVVQKWMRDRKVSAAPPPSTAVNKDRHADLQLIFHHLDAKRRGKISLNTIRTALDTVVLNEDPARQTSLAESIIGCFHAGGHCKRPGRAVDFKQFAAVMSSQEGGRAFLTLQDELRSDGLAAATALFANLFRREVVVRGLLDRGGADTLACSTFKNLFRAAGGGTAEGNRLQTARRLQAHIEARKKKDLEARRSVLAKQALIERYGQGGITNSCLVQDPSSGFRAGRAFASFPTIPRGDSNLSKSESSGRTSEVDGSDRPARDSVDKAEHSRADTKQEAASFVKGGSCRRGAPFGSSQAKALGSSRAEENVRLKREAIQEASTVLGLHYTPRPPQTPATQLIARSFRGHRLWGGGDNAAETRHCFSLVPLSGGFVRYPPPRVLRLRRQLRRCPQTALPTGAVATNGAGEAVPRGETSATASGKSAELPCSPMCRRRVFARLPSWASCHRSVDDSDTLSRHNRALSASKDVDTDREIAGPSVVIDDAISLIPATIDPQRWETSSAEKLVECTLSNGKDEGEGKDSRYTHETKPSAAAARAAGAKFAPPKIPTATAMVHDAERVFPATKSVILLDREPQTREDEGKYGFCDGPFRSRRRSSSKRRKGGRRESTGGQVGTARGPPQTPWRRPRLAKRMRRPQPGGIHPRTTCR